MEQNEFTYTDLLIRTRTGKKIHAGSSGSSVTNCGHWLKVNGAAMKFPKAQVMSALEKGEAVKNPSALGPATLILCQHCFPSGETTAAMIDARYERPYTIRDGRRVEVQPCR